MRFAIAIALVVLGCGKTDPAKSDDHGSAAGHQRASSSGLTVAHSVGELSGTYDKVFGKLANTDEPTTIAFVRGCPAIVCTDNVFEIESIAAKCPNAYLAIATLPSQDSKPGHRHSDLAFAGPAEKPVTATLEHVNLEITDIGPDGIAGTASQKTTESSVSGTFKAEICGRM